MADDLELDDQPEPEQDEFVLDVADEDLDAADLDDVEGEDEPEPEPRPRAPQQQQPDAAAAQIWRQQQQQAALQHAVAQRKAAIQKDYEKLAYEMGEDDKERFFEQLARQQIAQFLANEQQQQLAFSAKSRRQGLSPKIVQKVEAGYAIARQQGIPVTRDDVLTFLRGQALDKRRGQAQPSYSPARAPARHRTAADDALDRRLRRTAFKDLT